MLNILQIESSADFYHYFSELDTALKVVCPNPKVADSVRATFANQGISVESITISKFIKDELLSLEVDNLADNYRGKSELLILLGGIWAKLGRDKSIARFKTAFNLITELRSFSLNEQVLEEVLTNYDDEIRESVIWIHRFLEQLDIIDEHRSYFLFSEKLRDSDLPVEYPKDREIIFWGFEFLAGSQVDLLRSLALRDNVSIPIYKSVYEKAQGLDWIKWFDSHNQSILDISQPKENPPQAIYSEFPKGYLNKYISEVKDIQKNIVLGAKDISREMLQEISKTNLRFKTSVDLFNGAFEQAMLKTTEFIQNDKNEIDEIRSFIKKEMDQCVGEQNFLELKSFVIILNKFNYWAELSDENTVVTDFELYLIEEAAKLDLPRINYASLSSQYDFEVSSIRDIDQIKNKKVNMVFSSLYPKLGGGASKYTENVELYLGSIGPLRRAEFDLEILLAKLKEFYSDNEVTIISEENLQEHDLALNQLFESIELYKEKSPLDFSADKFKFSPALKSFVLQKISASRLQKYLDCPRKFYFDYVEKISPLVQFPSEVSVMDLGTIEHEVIELYFKKRKSKELDHKLFAQVVEAQIKQKIETKNLSNVALEEVVFEVKSYTLGAIELLLKLEEKYNLQVSFEFPFSITHAGVTYNGKIDCFLKSETHQFILDFKRSNASFNTLKKITEFEQIQLWFYLSRLKEMNAVDIDKLSFGYINLSELSSSTIFTSDKTTQMELKNEFEVKTSLIKDIQQSVIDYSNKEQLSIESLKNDNDFEMNPREESVCKFCAIEKICSKEFNNASS